MKCFGLIGFPLTHSFSEKYFTQKFLEEGLTDKACYKTFPLKEIAALPDLLELHPEICGLNITIPHKISILAYLHQTDPVAHEVRAVNTICITRKDDHPTLTGYNTDAAGFEHTLAGLPAFRSAMILGTGGASRAVSSVLKKRNIRFIRVSRRSEEPDAIAYDQLTSKVMEQYPCIINTTPCGTYPNIMEKPPIPYSYITAAHILYDLTYNPQETAFLLEGKKRQALTINGLPMLVNQAEESWRIWHQSFF